MVSGLELAQHFMHMPQAAGLHTGGVGRMQVGDRGRGVGEEGEATEKACSYMCEEVAQQPNGTKEHAQKN